MTDQEIAALRVKITMLESRYEAIITGTSPRVVVDQNGERVEFSQANSQKLYAYIQDLKSQLPAGDPGQPKFIKPLRFYF